MVVRSGVTQIVDDDFSRAKNFVAAAVTILERFQDGMVGLRRIVARGHRLLAIRVERLAEALLWFDPMAPEKLPELIEGHLHAVAKLFRRG
jgi:hypothetical protein